MHPIKIKDEKNIINLAAKKPGSADEQSVLDKIYPLLDPEIKDKKTRIDNH